MKFSLEATKAAAKQTGSMDLIEATEGLMNAWQDLTVAQRGMDEVCDVMDNIQTSIEHLQKFGDKSVAVLNADKSIESLLGLPEKLITAEKAQEGLGDAAKKAWDTLVEWCKKIWDAIASFCRKIVEFFTNKSEGNLKKIKETKERVKKGKKKPGNVTEGGVGGMRDPGEEGLNASLEAKAQLAGGGEMTYWKIGKFDTADKTLFLTTNFYPNVIMACQLSILKIATYINGRKSNVEEIKDAYKEAIEKLVSACKKSESIDVMLTVFDKFDIPSNHGLEGVKLNFPRKFSAPSNVDAKKLGSSGWSSSNLMQFLNQLEEAATYKQKFIAEKVEVAASNANGVSKALSRYVESNGDKISATKIYLQTASTAAQNLIRIINECMKAYVSIETGLTKVGEDAAKALGF